MQRPSTPDFFSYLLSDCKWTNLSIVVSLDTTQPKDYRICKQHEYGTHIALQCSRCKRLYSTKNIDHIGARSIFMENRWDQPRMKRVYRCPGGDCDLEHVCK